MAQSPPPVTQGKSSSTTEQAAKPIAGPSGNAKPTEEMTQVQKLGLKIHHLDTILNIEGSGGEK